MAMEEARVYLFDGLKIKQTGLFDLKELYLALFRWFEVQDYNFHEQEYSKVETGQTTNLTIKWAADRTEEDYVKYVLTMDFLVTGLQNVEVERDGVKIKTTKCTLEMRISAYLVLDYDGAMQKKVGGIGRRFYETVLAKKRMEGHEVALYNDTHMLLDEIKSFLAMHNLPK